MKCADDGCGTNGKGKGRNRMRQSDDASDALPVFAVRIGERALRDIDVAYVRFAEIASEEIAHEWRVNLLDAIAGLATLPRRFPLASEPFRHETRQMVYRRANHSAAYRVFYGMRGEQADAQDAPTVIILPVRHSAARPLTRREIRAIEAQE